MIAMPKILSSHHISQKPSVHKQYVQHASSLVGFLTNCGSSLPHIPGTSKTVSSLLYCISSRHLVNWSPHNNKGQLLYQRPLGTLRFHNSYIQIHLVNIRSKPYYRASNKHLVTWLVTWSSNRVHCIILKMGFNRMLFNQGYHRNHGFVQQMSLCLPSK